MRPQRSPVDFALISILALPIAPLVMQARAIATPVASLPIGDAAIALAPPNPRSADVGAGDVNRLLEAGKQQYRRAEFKQAIATYLRVIDLAEQQGDRSGQAKAMTELGRIDAEIGKTQEAEELGLGALKLIRAAGDRQAEADVLDSLVSFYLGRQDPKKANDFNQSAQAVAEAAGYQKGITRAKITLSVLRWLELFQKKQFQQALEVLKEGLKLVQDSGDQDDIASAYGLQFVYSALQDLPQAERLFQQYQTFSKSIGSRLEEYRGLKLAGDFTDLQKYPEKKVVYYQQALAIVQSADNPWFQKSTLLTLGVVYRTQKQPAKALAVYQQALAIAQSLQDFAMLGEIYNLIGVTYYNADQYQQAISPYQQALANYQKIGDQPTNIPWSWSNLGNAYYHSKQYLQALAAYEQALKGYQKLSDHPVEVAQVLSMIGYTYHEQKQYIKAVEVQQQALVIYQQLNKPEEVADRWSDISNAYTLQSIAFQHQKDYPQAKQLAEQGLEALQKRLVLVRQMPNRKLEMSTIFSIGQTQTQVGLTLHLAGQYAEALKRYEQALSSFQQALAITKELKDSQSIKGILDNIFSTRHGILNALSALNQYELASEQVPKMQEIAKETGDANHKRQLILVEYNIYNGLGNRFNTPEQYDRYLEILQKIIPLAEQLQPPGQELGSLSSIANIYRFRGQYAQALAMEQHILTRARELHSVEQEVSALLGMGLIYDAQANYPQALTFYEQALQISRAHQSSSSESTALNNMADIYMTQGQYGKALAIFQQSLAIDQNSYELLNKGVTPESIRWLCQQNNNIFKSGDFSEICKAPDRLPTGSIFDSFKNMISYSRDASRTLTGRRMNNLGQVYGDQGNYPQSLEFRQKALAIALEIGNLGDQATASNNIATIYMSQGEYTKAIDFVKQALKIALEQKHPSDEITYRANLGMIYGNWGRYSESLEALQYSLKQAGQLGQSSPKALLLTAIASVYGFQGDYAKALTNLQEARTIYQKIGEPIGMIHALGTTGTMYRKLGQLPQALDFQQQALTMAQAIGARPEESQVLTSLASTYQAQGKFDQALQRYQQGLAITQDIGDLDQSAKLLSGIGKLYLQQSQPAKALASLQQALTIQQRIGTRRDAAETLDSIGQAQVQLGSFAEAQSALQQSMTGAQEIGDRPTQAQALSHLGQLFARQKQSELAIVFYKQSVSITESIRHELGTLPKDQRQSYTETVADTYRKLADLLLQRDRVLEAQQVLDLLKVQELDDYLRNIRGAGKPLYELPPEQAILKKYNALQQSAINLGQELNTLEQQALNGTTLTAAQKQRKSELLALRQELKQQFLDFAKQADIAELLKQLTPTEIDVHIPLDDLAGFSKKLAKLNAVMIYPLVLDDRLELIITAPNAQPLRRTVNVSRQELNQTIQDFRAVLQNPHQDAKPIAQKLYNWLIKPLEADLQAAKPHTLIYAPDGQLRYIPLAALHDSQQWLVQRYGINNITAKSIDSFTDSPQRQLRVLAGAFGTTQQQIPFAGQTFSFAGLAFATKEVQNLAQLVPGTTTLFGPAFTQQATTNQMNDYTVVHLATHASIVPQSGNSFIVFGNGQATSLSEIENWTLDNVDLVVLSACETALGGKFGKNGEEVLGLGYQFTRKDKAKAAIASLWQVDDGGTQALMTVFYKALKQQKTKTAALQIAQQALIRGEFQSLGITRSDIEVQSTRTGQPIPAAQLSHPYYWAPFILIGNGL